MKTNANKDISKVSPRFASTIFVLLKENMGAYAGGLLTKLVRSIVLT